jgi:hypothetical protein
VLFGGAPGRSTDTWEWDGTNWLLVGSGTPGWRFGCAMAYDAGRQRVVLFGGRDEWDASTWEWDGTSWTASSPPNGPLARWGAAMAYDGLRQRSCSPADTVPDPRQVGVGRHDVGAARRHGEPGRPRAARHGLRRRAAEGRGLRRLPGRRSGFGDLGVGQRPLAALAPFDPGARSS